MARILLVDDEPGICRILSLVLTGRGHTVEIASSGPLAIAAAERERPDLAILDVSMPGMSGLEAFAELRRLDRDLPAIFVTAHGSIPSAIAAMRAGAFDYVTKPFDNEELLLTAERALEFRRLGQEVGRLTEELSGRLDFPGIVGRSAAIQGVLRLLPKMAASDATVLITGESGTGKELIAKSLHRHSDRASGPFEPVNCSAIPAGLVEDAFFGHERGAFTDAREPRPGHFEKAHGGSLFLDEVGELPLEAQAKLLRVLEDGSVSRLGSRKPVSVDVRVIAATNRNLEEAVAQGKFREDLFWRLSVLPLHLPPLRERPDDLPLLLDFFMDRLNAGHGSPLATLAPDARARLLAYHWPGNVRELENILKRVLILADGPVIQLSDLPAAVLRRTGPTDADAAGHDTLPTSLADAVGRAIARVERALIETTLALHRGNRTATAEALGINRKTLFTKMRAYGMERAYGVDSDAHDEEPA